jgi:hypothetical protein
MAAETVPLSVNSDGNLTIWWVPGLASNPLSAAVINAGTTKAITFSLTADGWDYKSEEAIVEDERLALKQALQDIGIVTDTLEIKYVFGDAGDVARVALTEGASGWFVVRYAKANDTTAVVNDKVDALPVKLGRQRKSAPVKNGTFTIMQRAVFKGVPKLDQAVVA